MSAGSSEAAGSGAARDGSAVAGLVAVLAAATAAALALTAPDALRDVAGRPGDFLAFLGLTLALQLVSVEVYGRGSLSFSGTGMLALGFAFGGPVAMAAAVAIASANALRRRAKPHRAVFDMAQLALAAGAAGAVYEAIVNPEWPLAARAGAAAVAAGAFLAINIGLLTVVMGLAEQLSPLAVWRERFRWFTPYYIASGPLALALTAAHERMGVMGLVAFALPPAFMMVSVRQYLARTRASVDEVRQVNEELRVANSELSARIDDLHELFQFASGLAARAHDRPGLVAYAESALGRLASGTARVSEDEAAPGLPLFSGGVRVGSLAVEAAPPASSEGGRWRRLSDTILPQLATALESSKLVEEVRQTHLATIAALSRSMEAKDYYTGGHTERVSDFAVAIAKRLGYDGRELDAIEIGALLHDIGKIGIPERILHKPGPLDEDEWKVMKEHPIISEYILADAGLPEIALQIARSSHERVDGCGYPDALVGDEIPLPARIVLVADAFDALTTNRPYRPGRHVYAAVQELRVETGTQFCPLVIDALEQVLREEPELLGVEPLRAVAGA